MTIEYFTYIPLLFCLIIAGVFTSCVEIESETSTEIQKKIINTDNAPAAVGVYSQAIQVGNTLYLSGQIGLIPESRELAGDDLESQTHQTLKNIRAVLKAAGYEMSDVVKAQVFLDDMNDYSAFNEVYVQYFPENPPARAVVEVSRIPLDAKVEIMVTAVKN
ncbi:RidA family protein [Gracilimonas sp. CAU 1638]|uniref:RidA family protein n=1 Tax=Gracilimonas sediminicola TaxID=2952158 RepID=A0A9X2RGS9_9BACT|nr:RidA family protein [Gracilimonas sediminicola]MCP9291733.1 RidA family protein [Gracilimonas sediminicola]